MTEMKKKDMNLNQKLEAVKNVNATTLAKIYNHFPAKSTKKLPDELK